MSKTVTKTFQMPVEPMLFKASAGVTDVENRIVQVIASNETPVERFSWERWEEYELILSHEKSAVDLTRVNNGVCCFFDGHPGSFFSNSKRIGKVIKASLENSQLVCTVKLNRTKEADQYLQDVEDGTEPGNSVGVHIKKMELISKAKYEDSEDQDDEDEERPRRKLKQPARYKATSWQINELSIVDVPAISSAGRKLSAEEQQKFDALPRYSVEVEGDEESLQLFENNPKGEPMPDENKSDRLQELADENRELKLQLTQSNKDKDASSTELSRVTLANDYWKLRCSAIGLYALENKLTEEEFKLDFSDDPQVDLQRLSDLGSDDARIELRTIDRALRRSALKSPVERLKDEKDKSIVSNPAINSKPENPVASDESLADDKDLEDFLSGYKPRQIK
ncbi:MAG: hypothetical protein ACRDBG_09780 [Waterburya sp.]